MRSPAFGDWLILLSWLLKAECELESLIDMCETGFWAPSPAALGGALWQEWSKWGALNWGSKLMLKQRRNFFTLLLDVRKFTRVLSEATKSTSPLTPIPQAKVTLVTVRKLSIFICETNENHNVSTRALKWDTMIGHQGKPSGRALDR